MKTKSQETSERTFQVNLLDLFLVLLLLLAGLAVYFTFVSPIRFSHSIQREAVKRIAEIQVLLPDDLSWMEKVLPVGEERRSVYGELEWKVIEVKTVKMGKEKKTKVTVRALISEKDPGVFSYGKYTLARGGMVYFVNDRYLIEGRVFDCRVLEEKIPR
jgi:hypothetical protein